MSLDGSAALATPADAPATAAGATDTTLQVSNAETGQVAGSVTIHADQPGPHGTTLDVGPSVLTLGGTSNSASGREANTTNPKCAVPRNDPELQVLQPSPPGSTRSCCRS